MKNMHPINRWIWPVMVCFLSFPAYTQQDPSQVFGELFEKVQMAKVFEDSKTFADCTPKFPPATIMERYEKQKTRRGFDLKRFVAQHFELPPTPASGFVSDRSLSVDAHIQQLWPVLTREPDTKGGSLLPLPKRYIVPGGRFREIYYWDSYFTMLGLQADGRIDLIADMADIFSYLVQTYGFIPNGNRAYYLSRSQPPFFSLMVALLAKEKGEAIWGEYLGSLEEFASQMDGKERLNQGQPAYRRVVMLPDGAILNCFCGDHPMPRPGPFEEEVVLAEKTGRAPKELYRHIRASNSHFSKNICHWPWQTGMGNPFNGGNGRRNPPLSVKTPLKGACFALSFVPSSKVPLAGLCPASTLAHCQNIQSRNC